MTITQTELLQHALIGYQAQVEEIQRRMEDVRQRLDGATTPTEERPKRHLSAKGRAAIIAATKRRWAKARRKKRSNER
jgi:penicillin V acylase-like amidase (Ntn superfamily)